MPTSTGESDSASPSGPSVLLKTVHGHWLDVLKPAVKSAASALPAASLTPAAPPLTVSVYECPSGSEADGVSVAVRVAASYETVDVTAAFWSSLSVTVVASMVDAVIDSSNVTVGFVAADWSSAPSAGVTEATFGGRVSAGGVVPNVASTQ